MDSPAPYPAPAEAPVNDTARWPVRALTSATDDREALIELRYRVLREPLGLARSAAVFGGDDAAGTVHLGAFSEDGALIGCATLMESGDGLHLRGMAVEAAWQGKGVGAALLQAAHDAAHGRPLWCNARQSAVGFYAHAGWRIDGDWFEVPRIGPHVPMRYDGA